jgi:hypothetical protein
LWIAPSNAHDMVAVAAWTPLVLRALSLVAQENISPLQYFDVPSIYTMRTF